MKLIIENANKRDIELLQIVVDYIKYCLEANELPGYIVGIGVNKHEVYASIGRNKNSFRILFHH